VLINGTGDSLFLSLDEQWFLCATVISVCYSARLQFFCLNSGVLLNVTCGQGGIDFAERNG
jgi:hypothetical protein